MKRQHAALVVHVDFDLFCGFSVRDCVGGFDGDGWGVVGCWVAARAEEGAYYAVLVFWSALGVVED